MSPVYMLTKQKFLSKRPKFLCKVLEKYYEPENLPWLDIVHASNFPSKNCISWECCHANNLKEILPIIELTVTEARLIENVLQDSLTKNHCDHRVFESLPLLLNVESEKKERGALREVPPDKWSSLNLKFAGGAGIELRSD